MNIIFANPAFLYGAAAAAGPLIFHLINRRKARVKDFPFIAFITASQRKVARKHKIQQWLLLILRTAAILLLVLLVSGPRLVSERSVAGSLESDAPFALILDNSLSMRYRQDGGTRLGRAKGAALRMLRRFPSGRRGILLTTVDWAREEETIPMDASSMLKEVEGVEPSYGSSDLVAALKRGYDFLADQRMPGRGIYIITDLTRRDWEPLHLSDLGRIDADVELRIINVGGPARDPNTTIRTVETYPLRAGVGTPVKIKATLANLGSEPIRLRQCQLHVDGARVDQKLVDLDPNQEKEVEFSVTFDRVGTHHGFIRIGPDDLPEDDTYYFTLEVGDKITPLLVDGDPRTSLLYSETFYLSNALNPARSEKGSLIVPKVITADGLDEADLTQHQVVFLCNVRRVKDNVRDRLADFVASGGGLVIFMGDKVSADEYNRQFLSGGEGLLPGRISGAAINSDDCCPIKDMETSHPALKPLTDVSKGDLSSPIFRRYLRVDREGLSPSTRTLLSLADGSPLLLEHRVGSGKVLLFTSTADLDWNNFALKTTYLPLMQNLVRYLAGMLDGAEPWEGVVGERAIIEIPAGKDEELARVTDPAGRESLVQIERIDERKAAVRHENRRPGIYAVSLADERTAYAINVEWEESDLQKMTPEELKGKLETLPIRYEEHGGGAATEGDIAGGERDLSGSLLLSLAAVLLVELFLVLRP